MWYIFGMYSNGKSETQPKTRTLTRAFSSTMKPPFKHVHLVMLCETQQNDEQVV